MKAGFRQEMINVLQSLSPYSAKDMVDLISMDNPKFRDFYSKGSRKQEILSKHSIAQGNPYGEHPLGELANETFNMFMYANIEPDKIKRLKEYRLMAAYDVMTNALDEICDEFVVTNDKGNIFNFDIDNKNLDKQAKSTLTDEFFKFVQMFDMENNGWEYVRNILIDGELIFENIIHEDHKDKGILGVVSVPTESIDPIYNNVQNLIVKGFLLRKEIYDPQSKKVTEIRPIIYEKNQITYFHSHEWNDNKTFRLPLVEKARTTYKRLNMIEDSIVVHRLVNAPEKMVFKVDVGNMPAQQAERYIRQLSHHYWNKKTFDSRQGGVNMFNPPTMLDAYWFPKRQGSEGTDVQRISGSQNLGDMPDLAHFTNKLYAAMNVPITRLSSDSGFSDGTEMLREELKFARFIIRLQKQFCETIKDSFITHLKLKQWWDEYELKEMQIKVKMNEPTHFNVLRKQQIFEIQYNNYSNMAASELISETYAQKKFLEWTDDEILANRQHLRKETEYKWELAQIAQWGPEWREMAKKEAEGAAEDFDPAVGGEGAGPMPGTDDTPPEFGDTPDVGEAEGADEPGAAEEADTGPEEEET